jgi:hypothetical protein
LFFTEGNIFQVFDGIAPILFVHHFYEPETPAFAGFFIKGHFG